jgi:hypothetical protein
LYEQDELPLKFYATAIIVIWIDTPCDAVEATSRRADALPQSRNVRKVPRADIVPIGGVTKNKIWPPKQKAPELSRAFRSIKTISGSKIREVFFEPTGVVCGALSLAHEASGGL